MRYEINEIDMYNVHVPQILQHFVGLLGYEQMPRRVRVRRYEAD